MNNIENNDIIDILSIVFIMNMIYIFYTNIQSWNGLYILIWLVWVIIWIIMILSSEKIILTWDELEIGDRLYSSGWYVYNFNTTEDSIYDYKDLEIYIIQEKDLDNKELFNKGIIKRATWWEFLWIIISLSSIALILVNIYKLI